MTRMSILILGGTLLLAACQTVPDESAPTAATPFVGKTLSGPNNTTFEFKADGTVGGVFRGESEIVGTYAASATEICSTYTAPEQLAGREFCSTPKMGADGIMFERRDGSTSGPYTLSE